MLPEILLKGKIMSEELKRPVSEPDGISGPNPEPKPEPELEIQDPVEHYRAKKGINRNK